MNLRNEAGAASFATPTPRISTHEDPNSLAALAGDYLAAIARQHGIGALLSQRLSEARAMLEATEGKPRARALAMQAYANHAQQIRAARGRLPLGR